MHPSMRSSAGFIIMTPLLTLLTLAALVAGPEPGHAAIPRPGGKLVPTAGAYLGAYSASGSWRGNDAYFAHLRSRERLIGRMFDIHNHFYSWRNPMPNGIEREDIDAGRIPMITWEPSIGLDAINDGSQDRFIAERARSLRNVDGELFMRWGHEMNGNWYPWGGPRANDPGKKNAPAKYVSAWRRVVSIFRSQGAHNVVWVWEPGAQNHPDEPWNHWRNYYPGDRFVDWVGIDGYNWGSVRGPGWTDFTDKFQAVYDDYAHRKPIMICETAATEKGGNKAQWIREATAAVKSRFPSVAAFLWFDADKETDWRFDTSRRSLDAFKALAHDRHFNPDRPGDAHQVGGSTKGRRSATGTVTG